MDYVQHRWWAVWDDAILSVCDVDISEFGISLLLRLYETWCLPAHRPDISTDRSILNVCRTINQSGRWLMHPSGDHPDMWAASSHWKLFRPSVETRIDPWGPAHESSAGAGGEAHSIRLIDGRGTSADFRAVRNLEVEDARKPQACLCIWIISFKEPVAPFFTLCQPFIGHFLLFSR